MVAEMVDGLEMSALCPALFTDVRLSRRRASPSAASEAESSAVGISVVELSEQAEVADGVIAGNDATELQALESIPGADADGITSATARAETAIPGVGNGGVLDDDS